MKVHRNFCYMGPNRRSNATIIELKIMFSLAEVQEFSREAFPRRLKNLSKIHPALTLEYNSDAEPLENLAKIFTQLCINLQRKANHIVSDTGIVSTNLVDTCQCWFEYEEQETGYETIDIVQDILSFFLDHSAHQQSDNNKLRLIQSFLEERIDHYLIKSRAKAIPSDCLALYNAARIRDLPIMRMDRPPFQPVKGDFRLRQHGLFCIGHGHRQNTVDGTFCVNLSEMSFPLIRDRKALLQKLAQLSIPMPQGDINNWGHGPARAARFADRLGYPVFLRSDQRSAGKFKGVALKNREDVMQAARQCLTDDTQFLIQKAAPGKTFKLLIAGHTLIAAFRKKDDLTLVETLTETHPSIIALAINITKTFNVGMALITLCASSLKDDTATGKLSIIDVELAPQLEKILTSDDPTLHKTALAFIDWIFPKPSDSRIPLIAVTGTNGKTTTCRMLEKILSATHLSTGLACSDGCYIAGEKISDHEYGTLLGHLTLLSDPRAEAGVLEATRGSAGSLGLGFDRCDVAICLNVTADHLNDHIETHSIEALAEVKRSILERAHTAVVLNADDPHCRAMMPHLEGRIPGLVSLQLTAPQLRELADPMGAIALIEHQNDCPWLIIYQGLQRLPVIAVADIPLCFDGAARHNVSNALHAALAAHLMGIDINSLSTGLRNLAATFAAVPGRLSFYRKLPFDVCMDYAHNPAGVKALCEFTHRLPVSGRRIISLSCSNNNSDEFIRETAAAAAGYFDHYICKNFGNTFQRSIDEGPRLLREGLLSAGVAAEDITCLEVNEHHAITQILTLGQKGDLIVIIGGKKRQEYWKIITETDTAEIPLLF